MASINDVAKLAKVSKSTVSLVINNTGYVSLATKQKVQAAMKELNYIPSQLAKNLSNKKSHLVGVVVPDVIHPFFATFVKAIEKELYEHGYMTMVCSTLGREKVELEYLQWLNRQTMDGLIMCVHTLEIEDYQATSRPIVSLDRFLSPNIPMVSSDHLQAAHLTVEQLRKNGCKKVVQFSGTSKGNIGADTFVEECARLFVEEQEELIIHPMPKHTFALEEYFEVAQEALDKYPDAQAFIGTDMVITQCLKVAWKKGIQIPEQLKLIAYDGTQITQMGPLAISAVVQPIEQLAVEAAAQLIAKIEGLPERKQSVPLAVSWSPGETCAIIND